MIRTLWNRLFAKTTPRLEPGRAALARRHRPALEALEDRCVPATIVALPNVGNQLFIFDSATPTNLSAPIEIQGLNTNEFVVGIDHRPLTGQLYGLAVDGGGVGTNARLLTINPRTGASTLVGTFTLPAGGNAYGFDFNPTVDRIRVVNTADVNLRINPDTGAITNTDTTLNPGGNQIDSAAYDRNVIGGGGTSTTLYTIGIDGMLKTIGSVNQTPSNPSTGTLMDVGPLNTPFDPGNLFAFDIKTTAGGEEVFAIFDSDQSAGVASSLYRINKATGAATLIGIVGDGTASYRGMAIVPEPDKIGIFNPSNGQWTRDTNGDGSGTAEVNIQFGQAGDIPVPGDWDRDGDDDMGVVRVHANGQLQWILDGNGNNMYDGADISFFFGQAGDIPVVGDWDRDGDDDFGVVRNNGGQLQWILDLNGNRAYDFATDFSFFYGVAGDTPIVGDWDGDGDDDLGISRVTNNVVQFVLDRDGNRSYTPADTSSFFGQRGDVAVKGDWDSDGDDDIGVVRALNDPAQGGNVLQWILDRNGDGLYDAGDFSSIFGYSGFTPITGEWPI